MTKRMLIDATHAEETRVAVVDDRDNKLLEFDYENKSRKPLKGSIFLAKVTRVEPSLQAAFVNFGGNRHGFLPFSEIHPDYFRIPISDREALLAEQDELLAEEEEREEAEDSKNDDSGDAPTSEGEIEEIDDVDEIEELNAEGGESVSGDDEDDSKGKSAKNKKDDKKPAKGRGRKSAKKDDEDADQGETHEEVSGNVAEPDEEEIEEQDVDGNSASAEGEEGDENSGNNRNNRRNNNNNNNSNNRRRGRGGRGRSGGSGGNNQRRGAAHNSRRVEVLGGTEYEDEAGNSASERFRFNLRRQYKIQEVIKRGQIMLIQASREERGNKGAAVSTYLSLPGRYGVLMPNSPRAGGVSRKIAKFEDRQRMRETLKEMDVPKGMSVILRTAGVTRTKTEIKRDVDYLMRLWDDIRERTLQSSAPALIYEEADLIKRAVRDLYARDVDEIQVSGAEGFEITKKFMKMMIPSHVKKVKDYQDAKIPLFHKYRVESQIAEMSETTAKLKSGGYLVINPTEALVSIDVNSGRATKERHIEETALNTNMEAAEEVARQLRLRDLGGLVVIDFIDMEDRRNNARVERKLKESLSGDRARIQIGRISSFGLLEMSRQRLNPSLTEAQYETCGHCDGRGVVRNRDTTSIMLLRALEDEGIKERAAQVIVHVSGDVAIYMLNNKRAHLDEIEKRYGYTVLIRTDDTLGIDKFRIEVARPLEDNVAATESEDVSESDTSTNEERETKRDNNRDGNREGNRDNNREGNRERDNTNGTGNSRRRGRRGGRGRGGRDRNNRDDNNENGNDQNNQNDQNEQPRDQRSDKGAGDNDINKSGDKRASSKTKEMKDDQSKDVKALQDTQSDAPKDAPKNSDDKKPVKAKSTARGRSKKDDAPKTDDVPPTSDAKVSKETKDKKEAVKDVKKDVKKTKAEPKAKAEKPVKETAAKKAVKDEPASADIKMPTASNDSAAQKKPKPPADYEVINEEPKSKKKGWWNKLVE